MKKIWSVAILFGFISVSYAGWFDSDPIQISASGVTNVSGGNTSPVGRQTVSMPARTERTCFTDVSASALNFPVTYAFSILQGPLTALATAYAVDLTTGPVRMSWDPAYPLCLDPGTTGYLQVVATSTTWKINASGYIKK